MFLTQEGGLLGPFAWVFGKLLDFMYNLLADGNGVANLGICIILFTIVVKVILLPMNIHTSKTSKINNMIQPEIKKIQKKYQGKTDQVSMMKQQEELQELYDKYGTSITGGCLPMLIQFPIIMSLYSVIQHVPAYVSKIKDVYTPIAEKILSLKGNNTAQFLTDYVKNNEITTVTTDLTKLEEVGVNNVIDVISNMSSTDLTDLLTNLKIQDVYMSNVDKINEIYSFALGINISEAPGYRLTWALLIPITSAAFNFLSMKLSMAKGGTGDAKSDSMMKSMMITMPVFSALICITLPAGVGIYWAMGAFISVILQIFTNIYFKHMDMDKFIAKQVAKAAKKKEKRGGKQSWVQRMMDTSEEAQKELEKREAMKKNAASSLKNYVPSESSKNTRDNNMNKKYKEGSIGSKANIMMNYNNKEDK